MNLSKVFSLSAAVLLIASLFSCASTPSEPAAPTITVAKQISDDIPSEPAVPDLQPGTDTIETSEPAFVPEPETTKILKHKGTDAGINLIPLWVNAYLSGGVPAVEAMQEFEDTTCYVHEAVSENLSEAYEQALAELPASDAREVSGWWMLVRIPGNDSTENKYQDLYFVYILYTSPKSAEPLN